MKKQLSLVLFGIVAISLTGCYTQLVVEENDDSYVYQPIIYYPAPEPNPFPAPLPHPPTKPVEPEYKTRPIKRQPGGKIRNPGTKRDPITLPKRDDFRNPGKIPEPVTSPPKSNDRIKDDSRNPGGRNDGGRKSRR